MQWSVKRPVTVDNREICATSAKNIMQALQETYLEYPSTALRKPSIVVISTTGASDTNEDVPFAFRFLYDILLADASKDKKDMERLVMGNTVDSDVAQPVFRGAVALRPSLLVGDQNIKGGKGWQTLKVGLQDSPAVGFTVHRADVGEWIYEQIIKRGDERWFGQLVTLTS
ncbi:hypothetical protein BGZ98_003588 [Dissophora globulifera]|nr:hypothetical protein BGZ98_003588 [Dissophora globulifera]